MDSMYTFEMLEQMGTAMSTGQMVYNAAMYILGIVGYILTAISVYNIAKRRGIAHPWLAWVPVVNMWVLGSISDQFRYVTKAQVKNKRTTLLVMSIILLVVGVASLVLSIVGSMQLIDQVMYASDEDALIASMTYFFKVMGLMLVMLGIAVAYCVVYYIALYDVFLSLNPDNAVLFLLLSIFVGVVYPFFLFFNRKKDDGMPPRCEVPQEPVVYSPMPEPAEQEIAPAPIEAFFEEAPAEDTPAEEAEEPAEQTEE